MLRTSLRVFGLPLVVFGLAATALYAAIAFDRISAESLRTNVTWLAADERAGRMTPSAGLEASADYIGTQFRLAGLAPGGSGGTYFQTAQFTKVTPVLDDFRMTLQSGGRRAGLGGNSVAVHALAALDYQDELVVRLPGGSANGGLAGLRGASWWAMRRLQQTNALYALEARKPSLILLTIDGSRPEEDEPVLMDADPSRPPVVRIYSRTAASLLTGRGEVRLTLHMAAPVRHDVALRNVAGILRGSDPAVRDQFVILSAHYDHLGMRPGGAGQPCLSRRE